eukprot:m.365539 g.365539  ORF g.365539 m.365539 type:complete len:94 (-) comp20817_c0_seq1:257-538(-)
MVVFKQVLRVLTSMPSPLHPIAPESTSANVIVLILNVAAFVYLFITDPLLRKKVLNLVISGIAVAALLLCSQAKVSYKRGLFDNFADAASTST